MLKSAYHCQMRYNSALPPSSSMRNVACLSRLPATHAMLFVLGCHCHNMMQASFQAFTRRPRQKGQVMLGVARAKCAMRVRVRTALLLLQAAAQRVPACLQLATRRSQLFILSLSPVLSLLPGCHILVVGSLSLAVAATPLQSHCLPQKR